MCNSTEIDVNRNAISRLQLRYHVGDIFNLNNGDIPLDSVLKSFAEPQGTVGSTFGVQGNDLFHLLNWEFICFKLTWTVQYV